jgi:hypothetical protein
VAFPPAFDRALDETFPPDTQLGNLLGADIRNLKTDIRERLALLSGILANRPSNMDAAFGGAGYGILYFATDTSQVFQWSGAAWVDVSSVIGATTAKALATTGAAVVINGAAPPTVGQVLVATSPTVAAWEAQTAKYSDFTVHQYVNPAGNQVGNSVVIPASILVPGSQVQINARAHSSSGSLTGTPTFGLAIGATPVFSIGMNNINFQGECSFTVVSAAVERGIATVGGGAFSYDDTFVAANGVTISTNLGIIGATITTFTLDYLVVTVFA